MLPQAILDIARRSDAGLISTPQAAEAGFGHWHLTAWVRAGSLERLMIGWYRVAGAPIHPLQSLHLTQSYLEGRQRNCRSAARGARTSLLTGRGAAYLLGSDAFLPPFRPYALIPHDRRIRIADPPFDISRRDLRTIGGSRRQKLWVAHVATVLLDLAADRSLSAKDLRVAGWELLRGSRMTSAELEAAVAGAVGEGAVRLRAMIAAGVFDVESEMEWQVLTSIFGSHPPAPDCQVWVSDRWRVDFAFVFAALVLEFHGRASHRDRVDEDGVRMHGIDRMGLKVMVITKSLMSDPDGLAAHIHEVRRHREQEMLLGHLIRPHLPRQPDRRVPLRTLVPFG